MLPMQLSVTRLFTMVLLLLGGSGALPSAAAPNILFFHGSTYAAIAYSEETGKYGYAYDCPSRDIAEVLARRRCQARDAKVVAWVNNGFCALALGDRGAYGTGWSNGNGASNAAAKNTALAECAQRGKNARLVLCVCSLDRKPEVFE